MFSYREIIGVATFLVVASTGVMGEVSVNCSQDRTTAPYNRGACTTCLTEAEKLLFENVNVEQDPNGYFAQAHIGGVYCEVRYPPCTKMNHPSIPYIGTAIDIQCLSNNAKTGFAADSDTDISGGCSSSAAVVPQQKFAQESKEIEALRIANADKTKVKTLSNSEIEKHFIEDDYKYIEGHKKRQNSPGC